MNLNLHLKQSSNQNALVTCHSIGYICYMTRFVAHLLILLVLFTHSTIAMDVHIPHEEDHTLSHATEHTTNDTANTSFDNVEQSLCVDAGGHCSHHQAHAAGLVTINNLPDTQTSSVSLSLIKHSVFIYSQAPPLRPPKV